ncbi:MAG: hypothetical protein BGO49_28545 [Planctomycetales bacterium 71-10]|nr:MAG: hypothetical protein BGO49_28545 [Planctomycetales bacterium 71-10]
MIDVVLAFGILGTLAVIFMMIASYFFESLNDEEFYDQTYTEEQICRPSETSDKVDNQHA